MTRRWFAAAVTLVVAALLSGMSMASAATLGGIGASDLTAFDELADPGAPTVISFENFDGPNNTNISGTTPDWGPGVWRSLGGTWRIRNNQAQSTSVSLGSINVHLGVSDGAAEVTLDRRNGTGWNAGLLFNDNDYSVLLVLWQAAGNGSLTLYKWNGSFTQLATVNNLYSGANPAPQEVQLRVRTVGSLVEASLDGTLILTHTLSPADTGLFKNAAHDGWGLWAESDSRTRFDNFHVDTP